MVEIVLMAKARDVVHSIRDRKGTERNGTRSDFFSDFRSRSVPFLVISLFLRSRSVPFRRNAIRSVPFRRNAIRSDPFPLCSQKKILIFFLEFYFSFKIVFLFLIESDRLSLSDIEYEYEYFYRFRKRSKR